VAYFNAVSQYLPVKTKGSREELLKLTEFEPHLRPDSRSDTFTLCQDAQTGRQRGDVTLHGGLLFGALPVKLRET
jgi:hypothetical protein